MKERLRILLVTSKETGIEVNDEKSMYTSCLVNTMKDYITNINMGNQPIKICGRFHIFGKSKGKR